jgi:hypothetical protein
VQDPLAPDLKAISASLDAIERPVQTSEANLSRQISDLKTPLDPDKRLSRVEPQLAEQRPAA